MAHLRKITLEELERRNYSETTIRAYLRTIDDFARYFKRPPDQLGPEQIREYVAYLFRERKLAGNTVNQRVGALRFFFVKTLKLSWNIEETPYPKKRIHLPVILSPPGRVAPYAEYTGMLLEHDTAIVDTDTHVEERAPLTAPIEAAEKHLAL